MHTKHPTYSPIMINFTPQLHRTLHKTAFILVNNTACSQLAQQENKTFAPRKNTIAPPQKLVLLHKKRPTFSLMTELYMEGEEEVLGGLLVLLLVVTTGILGLLTGWWLFCFVPEEVITAILDIVLSFVTS